jgi:hypothetical protein
MEQKKHGRQLVFDGNVFRGSSTTTNWNVCAFFGHYNAWACEQVPLVFKNNDVYMNVQSEWGIWTNFLTDAVFENNTIHPLNAPIIPADFVTYAQNTVPFAVSDTNIGVWLGHEDWAVSLPYANLYPQALIAAGKGNMIRNNRIAGDSVQVNQNFLVDCGTLFGYAFPGINPNGTMCIMNEIDTNCIDWTMEGGWTLLTGADFYVLGHNDGLYVLATQAYNPPYIVSVNADNETINTTNKFKGPGMSVGHCKDATRIGTHPRDKFARQIPRNIPRHA